MAEQVLESNYEAIQLDPPELRAAFLGLAGLVGEATADSRAFRYIAQFRSAEDNKGVVRYWGDFALQVAQGTGDEANLQFAISEESKGVCTEEPRSPEAWRVRNPLGRLVTTVVKPRKIEASVVLDTAQDMLAGAPRLDVPRPQVRLLPNSSRAAMMYGHDFVPVLGRMLRFAKTIPYGRVDAGADTAASIVLGRGTDGLEQHFHANAKSRWGTKLEFRLTHFHTESTGPNDPQVVSIESSLQVNPAHRDHGILYAYDALNTLPDGQTYRVRRQVPISNSRHHQDRSIQPATPNDVLRLAASMADPDAYLERYWPELA